eukprot:11219219-Lingulodinium_polyedra.AAC.1
MHHASVQCKRQREKQTGRGRHAKTKADFHRDMDRDRQTDRQRQTGRQADRQRQTEKDLVP